MDAQIIKWSKKIILQFFNEDEFKYETVELVTLGM